MASKGIVEGEAWVYPSAKGGSKGNVSASGRILAGNGTVLAGAYAAYSSTPEWEKWTISPMALVRISSESARTDLFAVGPDGDKVDWSVGARISGRSRIAPIFEYEYVQHSAGTGSKFTGGILWRIHQ